MAGLFATQMPHCAAASVPSTYRSPTGARNMRIPERFNAASSPMFDMVVATTTSPVNIPRAFRSRAAISRIAVAIDDVAVRARQHAPVRITVECQPGRCLPRFCTSAATHCGCNAPQPSLMLRPSGEILSSANSFGIRAPSLENNSGATAAAAPFAQSATMRKPSSLKPGTQSMRN